jgi:outer membrane protein
MKGLRLLMAVVFGATLFGSAAFLCRQAQAAGVVSPGTGGDMAPAQEPTAKATRVQLGLGAGVVPDYEGSKDYKGAPWLFARVDWPSGMYFLLEGASARMNLVPSPNWRLGPVLRYIPAREDVQNDQVADLRDVDSAVMLGGFAGYDFGRWSTFVQLVQDVSGSNDGYVATLGLGYAMPVSKQLLVAFSGTTNYASGDYMSTYFGINAADSARSGLKTYNANAGFKDVGAGVLLQYYPWDHWGFRVRAMYTRLVGDAEDSPVVDDEGDANQFVGGMLLIYRF